MDTIRESFIYLLFGLIFIAGVSGVFGYLPSEQTAVDTLETQGFSEIEVTDRSVFMVPLRGCGEQDVALFTAEAINPAGEDVTVHVCQGWPFKGATIRGT